MSMQSAGSIGEAFVQPFGRPRWLGRMVLQGLVAWIPVLGQIALSGWMMQTIDGYRGGRRDLPRAGFAFSRGVGVFFALLVYDIVLSLPGSALTAAAGASRSAELDAFGNLLHTLGWLLLVFLSPAVILLVYREGFAAGFDFGRLWRMVSGSNLGSTVVAAVVVAAAVIIAGVGALFCLVVTLFTLPYAQAVIAGAVTWYERAAVPDPRGTPA